MALIDQLAEVHAALMAGCTISHVSQTSSSAAPWTVGRLLQWTKEHLAAKGVDSPRLATELLLAHALQCERIDLYTKFDQVPDEPVLALFRDLVKRAARREPIAYLVGERDFFSLSFAVGPGVLVPRPETEHVVELCLDTLGVAHTASPTKRRSKEFIAFERELAGSTAIESQPGNTSVSAHNDSTPVHIWDLGTGSGCIAITLAVRLKAAKRPARVVASDISPVALTRAAENATRNGVPELMTLVHADGLDLPPEHCPAGGFDLVVSNPPYIGERERPGLPPELAFEPPEALFAGDDGLAFYRRLVFARRLLAPAGTLVVEAGAGQAGDITAIMQAAGFTAGPTRKDLLGHVRALAFTHSRSFGPCVS